MRITLTRTSMRLHAAIAALALTTGLVVGGTPGTAHWIETGLNTLGALAGGDDTPGVWEWQQWADPPARGRGTAAS
jgi:hypothetical protein